MLNDVRLPAGITILSPPVGREPSPSLPDGIAGRSAAFEHNGRPHDDPAHKTRSQGEIEAAICEGMARFMQAFMGRGPKAIHSHLIADLVVIRVQGVLTAAEQHLFTTLEPRGCARPASSIAAPPAGPERRAVSPRACGRNSWNHRGPVSVP